MEILIHWAGLTLGMFVASKLLARMEIDGGLGTHLAVSGVFGLLLALTGWAFHLALGLSSLGLLFVFGFVAQVLVGAIVLKITDALFARLRVDGFGTALLAALTIGLTGALARAALRAVA